MFGIRRFSLNCLKSPALQTLLRYSNFSTAKLTAVIESTTTLDNSKEEIKTVVPKFKEFKSSNLVASAFASLQDDSNNKPITYNDKRISKASTVDELLSIANNGVLSRQNALKIVSVLAQWTTARKVNISEFETDQRFVKICRVLSRTNDKKKPMRVVGGDDLSTVLGVTGDDEAAKLVASISLPQMVKVMSTLSQKKRRSTPLLRSLAYNICSTTTKLDLKQCADLLYSMTVLNFPEPVLLERIGNDIIEVLNTNNDRSAVVGSILTSIGLMRYKEIGLLEALSEWILKHHEICRPQDIFSLFLTLAITNHHPENAENLFKVLVPQLNISNTQRPSTWLDVIWSLVILNQAKETHLLSIFNSEFMEKLAGRNGLSIPAKVKLLNINAVATHLIPDYKGPLLKDVCKENIEVPLSRTKDKQVLVSAVLDSLSSLFPSQIYLKNNVDTKMGFFIDGECLIDKKCTPLPVDTENLTNKIRIAILVYDFYDTCRGLTDHHGGNELSERLLKATGYKVMTIPYNEYNPRDKVVQRVQYIEKQLKQIASTA